MTVFFHGIPIFSNLFVLLCIFMYNDVERREKYG